MTVICATSFLCSLTYEFALTVVASHGVVQAINLNITYRELMQNFRGRQATREYRWR